jgi:hypothetical protein
MGNDIFTKLTDKYPFITLCVYATTEYVGIIQNQDEIVTTIYDFGSILDLEDKRRFLELANVWWWESNRTIPINIFLKEDWGQFRYVVKTLLTKEVTLIAGHTVKLMDLASKRTKRKMVQLMRRPPAQ